MCGAWPACHLVAKLLPSEHQSLALEQDAAAVDAEKQANKKRRKEKQRALAEEQAPAAPAVADQAPINEADLFGDNEVQACSWHSFEVVL